MPLRKSAEEIGGVIAVNSTAIGLTFTDIENGLKILLLVVSLAYTLDKWHSHRKEINKNK